jgi:DNA-binding transcriptional MerR regulator
VELLQHIRSLQALGLSLEEIAVTLDRQAPPLKETLGRQVAALDERIAALSVLRRRLDGLIAFVERNGAAGSDDLLTVMKEMNMVEKHYTKEQLDVLAERAAGLGEEGMRQAEAQWADLIDRVRKAKETGVDPASPAVRAMAAEWQSLIDAFTGGDPGIRQSLDRVWQEEQTVSGYDTAEMGELVGYLHGASGA